MGFSTLFGLYICHLRNHYRRLRGLAPRPYKWLIQVTNDCNSRCQTCDIWRLYKDHPELSHQELAIEKYRELFQQHGADLRWLAFSGGEVTLYQHWDELIELIAMYCPKLKMVTFTSNALLPEKVLELATKLQVLKARLFVVLSLDGDEALHDRLRGVKGNAALVERTKQLLKSAGVQVYLGATLSGLNASFWKEQEDPCAQSFSLVHSGGIFEKSVELEDEKILVALRSILKKYKIRSLSELGEYFYLCLATVFLKSHRKELPLPCASLQSSLHFTPYGQVQACMYMPQLGSLKEKSLAEILDSDETQKQLEQIKRHECPKCWMNCYAPHSILEHPIKTLVQWGKSR